MSPKWSLPFIFSIKILYMVLISLKCATCPAPLTFLDFIKIRGPFEKFVDSPYYSESELYGGAVTVSVSLGKRCTSYNAPPTSRKRAADLLPQASGG
jgi:hypothetical protein